MKKAYIKRALTAALTAAMFVSAIPVYADEEILPLAEETIQTLAEEPLQPLAEETVQETPQTEAPQTEAAPETDPPTAETPSETEPPATEAPQTELPSETEPPSSESQADKTEEPETKAETEQKKDKDSKEEKESETETAASEREDEDLTVTGSANPNADLESSAVWESTIPALSGIWRDDIISIARSQLGYRESASNYVMENGSAKGYTRYGAWYGIPYGDWCAMFASFCIYYAGVPSDMLPLNSYTVTWIQQLSALGLYQNKGNGYVPQPGDLIFFARDGVNVTHVGLVEYVSTDEAGNATQITTIEGNSSNMVRENTYSPYDGYIIGYGMIPDQPEDMIPKTAGITIEDAGSEEDVKNALILIKQQMETDAEEENKDADDSEEESLSADEIMNSIADIRQMMS